MYDMILQHIAFKDIVDIVLVAIIVFQFLQIIQGTRAVQMLFGVFALGALFALSIKYELFAVNWLLSHFFNAFLFILVILFQDQIRSGLASFGSKRVFGKSNIDYPNSDSESVAEACGILSRKKIGALIIFERSTGLKNIVNTGIKIDAALHPDLIFSIFDSKSALHDGAIIVSHGKIIAAGAFLPMSQNQEIERHLGTRHRAALGITEESDALAVVVSEETGKISVAFNGYFFNASDANHLRRYLRNISGNDKALLRRLDALKES